MKNTFEYKGYMDTDAVRFFKGNVIVEQRDGINTIGSFIKLSDGATMLPSKGDVFTRMEDGTLTVKSKYRV